MHPVAGQLGIVLADTEPHQHPGICQGNRLVRDIEICYKALGEYIQWFGHSTKAVLGDNNYNNNARCTEMVKKKKKSNWPTLTYKCDSQ